MQKWKEKKQKNENLPGIAAGAKAGAGMAKPPKAPPAAGIPVGAAAGAGG